MDCPSVPAEPRFAFTRLYASHTSHREIQNGFVLFTGFLPSLVDPKIRPDNAAPSVQSHYRTFLPTTSCSAPVSRIGTLTLVGLPLEFLPSHRNDRFPRSTQKPESGSRHLYAGCRPSSKQVTLGLILESRKYPSSDITQKVSTPHQWFALARLPESHLTGSLPCLFLNAHHNGSLPSQLKVV